MMKIGALVEMIVFPITLTPTRYRLEGLCPTWPLMHTENCSHPERVSGRVNTIMKQFE